MWSGEVMPEVPSRPAADALHDLVNGIAHRLAPALITVSSLLSQTALRLSDLKSRLVPRRSLAVSLAISITLLASLRVAGGCVFPQRKQLRQRALLLARVRHIVARWEAAIEEEVLYRCVGISATADETASLAAWCRDAETAEQLLRFWTSAAAAREASGSDGPFQGIVSSVVFAPDFDLVSYIETVHMAEQMLTAGDDKQWVERLALIVLFAIFRRLAVAEEARHVAALWRRYVLLGGGAREAPSTSTSPLSCGPPPPPAPAASAAWRAFGRPTWLVPLPATAPQPVWASSRCAVRCYLGMPLSYFPVASVLTCLSEETWLSPASCIAHALPRWRARSLATLRTWPALATADAATPQARTAVVATKVSYLFLRYGHPLAREQTQRAEADANRFVADKLFRGVRQTVAAVVGADGTGVVLRDPARERRVRTLTAACTVCGIVTTFMNACLPHLTTADMMCIVSLSVFSAARAAGEDGGPAGTAAASVDADAVERLAAQLVWHLVTSIFTGIAEVFVQRVTASLRESLAALLSEELTEQLMAQLLAVDEAFLVRFVQGSQERSDAAGSPYSRRESGKKESVAQLVKCAESGGGSLVGYHQQRVRRTCLMLAMAGMALYHREPAAVAVAALMSLDAQTFLGTLLQAAGVVSLDDYASSSSYDNADDALPTARPQGLALLLDVLAEDHDGTTLAHPFLSLVACSAVWQHTGSASDKSAADDAALAHATRVAALYRRVVMHRYDLAATAGGPHRRRFLFTAGRPVDARMQSMRLDAECILAYPVAEWVQEVSTADADDAPPGSPSRLTASDGGPRLDQAEEALLHSTAAAEYVPPSVDYFDLFAAPTRFVLRQLGMEMMFAQRTIAGLRQSAPQDASAELEDLFSSATFNPITWLLTDLVEALQSFLVVAASCGTWRDGRLYVRPTDPQRVYSRYGRVQRYQRLVGGYRRHGGHVQQLLAIRRLQQVCECMPSTINDAAPLSHCREVVARRRAWAAWRGTDGDVPLDACGRLCSGFRLQHGITLDHVYFAYPQLHHYTTTHATVLAATAAGADESGGRDLPCVGAHRPVLRAASCHFSADGMSALIGPTGSGKSSTVALLTRHYDALPPLCVADGESTWSDTLLGRLLYLQAIEAALPLPPDARHDATVTDNHDGCVASLLYDGREGNVCGVRIDGIPLACFSVAYLRQWAAHLEQSPHVYEKMSFFDNVRLLRPDMSYADATEAALMCRCAPFIQDKPQQLLHQTGTLSGGEQQRLALARVVAAMRARVRSETLSAPYTAAHDDDDTRTAVDGLLLLDEPTSRLDAYNELEVLGTIEGLTRGSWGDIRLLVIAIAHRLSTLRAAQYVVVVEDGTVTCEGPPAEVIERSAFAKEQWRLQELS